MLDTDQIKQLIPQVGPQAKLMKKHTAILKTLVCYFISVVHNVMLLTTLCIAHPQSAYGYKHVDLTL